VSLQAGFQPATISALEEMIQEADSLGLKYLSIECSTYLADALIQSGEYARARKELEAARWQSEKLGLRVLLARSNYLLARTFRLTDNGAEARRQYQQALRILGEIRKEAGSEELMKRTDLNAIFVESTQWSNAPPA
jgi:tetratricopeptide (TPR) repeat protein